MGVCAAPCRCIARAGAHRRPIAQISLPHRPESARRFCGVAAVRVPGVAALRGAFYAMPRVEPRQGAPTSTTKAALLHATGVLCV